MGGLQGEEHDEAPDAGEQEEEDGEQAEATQAGGRYPAFAASLAAASRFC